MQILTRLLYFTLGKLIKKPSEFKIKDEKKLKTSKDENDENIYFIFGSDKVILPTFTSFMGMDLNEHIIEGCAVDKFELSADKDFITFKMDMKGIKSVLKPIKPITDLKFNQDYPLAYFEIDLYMREIGSNEPWGDQNKISYKTQKLTFSIENGVDEASGQHIGSRFASFLIAGERNIKLSFDTLYLDNTWFRYLWNHETGPQETGGSTEVEVAMKIDAGNHGSMLIELPRALITGVSFDSSGTDIMVQTVNIETYTKNIQIPLENPITVNTECLITSKTKIGEIKR